MEYKDLISIWKIASEKQTSDNQMSIEEVRLALTKRSNTIISKIKRNLKIKMWIQTMMGFLGTIYFAIQLQDKFAEEPKVIMIFLMFLIILALGIHKRINYTKIVNFQKSSEPLRTSLTRITDIMNKVVQAQIYTTVILATFFAVSLTYVYLYADDRLLFDSRIFILGAVAIAAPIFFYFFAKRGQKRMFGDYIQSLKNCANELETTRDDSDSE